MKYRTKARLVLWLGLLAGSLLVMAMSGCGMVEGIGHDLQHSSRAARTWLIEYGDGRQ